MQADPVDRDARGQPTLGIIMQGFQLVWIKIAHALS